jgi:hypothetical protein
MCFYANKRKWKRKPLASLLLCGFRFLRSFVTGLLQ